MAPTSSRRPLAGLAVLLCCAPFAGAQNRVTPQLFRALDKNGDGRVTAKELGRPRLFQALDKDGDELVALAEMRQHYRTRALPAWMRRLKILPVPDLVEPRATRVSTGATWDNQPAVAETRDGTAWVARVRHHYKHGDDVAVVAIRGDRVGDAEVLTPALGQYVRPAIAASGDEVWCVWTRAEPTRRASVWYSRRRAGRWSAAERVTADQPRAHHNPEITAGPDGRVAIAYQVFDGARHDIHLREWDGSRWQPARSISSPAANDWDPALAYDSDGVLHAVWCAFIDGDYDVWWRRFPGDEPARRISARGEYDLHPWLAAGDDGAVWVSWDVVRIPGHTSSGRTTITGANKLRNRDSDGRGGARSFVQVAVLDGDAIRTPGKPRAQITAPQGYQLAHCGMAKVAIARGGEPWVLYRVLRRNTNPWLPGGGIGYFWELLARPFRDGKWQRPLRMAAGDGYLEEASAAASVRGLRVAYGGERRSATVDRFARRTGRNKKKRSDTPEASAGGGNHHTDFAGFAGCNGDVLTTLLGASDARGPATAELPAAAPVADRAVRDGRLRADPYVVERGGKKLRLLWGDTHRHSNVSRCSAGAEPSPDDLYRYGTDVCRYDFFALSDHSEHHSLTARDKSHYYWWLQQKLADLYHVPGAFSVLYNFEWTLTFPHGHHNTIFPSRPTVRLARNLAGTDTLQGGWDVLSKAGVRAITIPHTGADPRMGTAWEIQDDRYQRVCEIFQACRGSYEHAGCPREFRQTGNKKGFYWNALEKGYHVGVIASTDHGYGVAYACVYAPQNTREAIWQAMWDRRTYGSTTYGLVLDVSSGERWMGEEWSSRDAPELSIRVRGAAPLCSIEVIGRSKVLHAVGSVDAPIGEAEKHLTWRDAEWSKQTDEQWYYVRVIQTDDEMAWSSPVWVKPMAR